MSFFSHSAIKLANSFSIIGIRLPVTPQLRHLSFFEALIGTFIRNFLGTAIITAFGTSEYRFLAGMSILYSGTSGNINFFFFCHINMTLLIQTAASQPIFIIRKHSWHQNHPSHKYTSLMIAAFICEQVI